MTANECRFLILSPMRLPVSPLGLRDFSLFYRGFGFWSPSVLYGVLCNRSHDL